jgi:hypothetical protein
MYGFLTEEIVRGLHLVFLFGTTTSRIVFGRRENLIFAATNEFSTRFDRLPQRDRGCGMAFNRLRSLCDQHFLQVVEGGAIEFCDFIVAAPNNNK